jgi:heat shock protein beta
MDIIVNALYTHKEVFLREIISNASDALDKIRFLSLKDPELLGALKNLKIMIEYNKEDKTVSITDTGIGMTKEELVKNLGTVAKSGTAAFAEALSKGDVNNLIGQFGVGFYSTYLVAKKVVVTSKNNNDEQYIWVSQAGSSFTVIKDPKGNTLGRGTRVTLYLKDDAIEFIEQDTLKNLAKRYSEFINYPIEILLQKQITKEVEEEPKEESKEEPKEDKDEVEVTDEEKEEPKKKTVTETVWEWELVNQEKALWLRNKDEITEEEYNNFYKALSKGNEDPLTYTHIKAEGDIEFKSILYVPSSAPYDIFENYYGKSNAIKLYVKRVLVTDEFEELLPRYMNFIRGILDSDDLPLNVNREQLQQHKVLKVMTKKLVRNAIKMLENLAAGKDKTPSKTKSEEDDDENEEQEEIKVETNETSNATAKYEKFWHTFGKNIKLGIIEDSSNRNSLSKLLRFYTTKSMNNLTSLDEYLERKQPKQNIIYYLAGDDRDVLFKSPLLQKLKNANIEVILMDDPIDEYCMNSLSEYEQNKIQNAAKGNIILPEDPELQKRKQKKLQEMYKPLTEWWRKHLGRKVEKVEISMRLVDSPCAVSTSEYGYSANMEKISKAQAFSNRDKMADYLLAKRILEINPGHPVIKKMLEKVKEAGEAEPTADIVEMSDVLFDSALLNSGFSIEDINNYFDKMEKIVRKGFDIDEKETVEEPVIDLDDDEDIKDKSSEEEEKPKEDEDKATEDEPQKEEEQHEEQREETEEKKEDL